MLNNKFEEIRTICMVIIFLVLDTGCWVLGTGYWVPGARFLIQNVGMLDLPVSRQVDKLCNRFVQNAFLKYNDTHQRINNSTFYFSHSHFV